MPVTKLFCDARGCKKQGAEVTSVSAGDQMFEYVVIYEPHQKSKREIKEAIVNILAGKCLGITEEDVKKNIASSNYTAVIQVSNKAADDKAICSIQYTDHCGTGAPQLWIHDLCRLTNKDIPKASRPAVSPVSVLLDQVEKLARGVGVTELRMLVSNDDAAVSAVLERIYTGYGYKVANGVNAPKCNVSALGDYKVMSKSIVVAAAPAAAAPAVGGAGGAGMVMGGGSRRRRQTRRKRHSRR